MTLTRRRITESEFLHAVNRDIRLTPVSFTAFRYSRSSIAYSESSVWVFIIVYILNMSHTPAFSSINVSVSQAVRLSSYFHVRVQKAHRPPVTTFIKGLDVIIRASVERRLPLSDDSGCPLPSFQCQDAPTSDYVKLHRYV